MGARTNTVGGAGNVGRLLITEGCKRTGRCGLSTSLRVCARQSVNLAQAAPIEALMWPNGPIVMTAPKPEW